MVHRFFLFLFVRIINFCSLELQKKQKKNESQIPGNLHIWEPNRGKYSALFCGKTKFTVKGRCVKNTCHMTSAGPAMSTTVSPSVLSVGRSWVMITWYLKRNLETNPF